MVFAMEAVKHAYEVRPREDKRGVTLTSDALPFGWAEFGQQCNRLRDALQPIT